MSASGAKLLLADGRRLSFVEYGDRRGYPVLWFHSIPGSALEAKIAESYAHHYGLRLIAFDRPGYGESTPSTQRLDASMQRDVLHVAERLGLSQLSIVGCSAGAIFALQAASRLAARVDAICLLAPIFPRAWTSFEDATSGLWGWLSRRRSWLRRQQIMSLAKKLERAPERALRWALSRFATPQDLAVLDRPGVMDRVAPSVERAFAQGSEAALQELEYLEIGHFPYPRATTSAPDVFIWNTRSHAVTNSRAIAKLLGTAANWELRTVAYEGQVSLVANYVGDAMLQLAMRLGRSPSRPFASMLWGQDGHPLSIGMDERIAQVVRIARAAILERPTTNLSTAEFLDVESGPKSSRE